VQRAVAQLVEGMPALSRARFEPETAREVDRLGTGDGGGVDLVWIQVMTRAGAPVLVVAAGDGERAVPPARALAMLSAGRPDRRWTTRAGGGVRWTGPAVRACGRTSGLAETATNDLQAVDVDGRPAVLKVYRVLGSDRGEGHVLAALDGAFVPRRMAQISYHPPGGGPVMCLALVTERLPGRTLDEPLLESLRHTWCTGRSGLDRPTLMALTCVQSALSGFHAALRQRYAPHVPRDPRRAVHVRRDALRAEVRALLRDEPDHAAADVGACSAVGRTAQARTGARAVLAATAAAAIRPARVDVAPAHGDLHLAHVVLNGEQVRFVDVAQPEPYGSPADDAAALRRAVECMALDVVVDRAAAERSRPAHEVVGELLTRALCTASTGLGRPVDALRPLETVVPRELTAARAWTAQVCDRLDPLGADGPPGLPYLSRLVHDLRHHSECGDRYYAGLAWCHLVEACSVAAPRRPRALLRKEAR
jgi:hypothetical protein